MERPDQSAEGDLRSQALRRLEKRKQFRTHLFTYVLVNVLLILVWLGTAISAGDGAWFPWPIFPLLGWGIGLAFHARSVYGTGITEADIQQEMNRLKGV